MISLIHRLTQREALCSPASQADDVCQQPTSRAPCRSSVGGSTSPASSSSSSRGVRSCSTAAATGRRGRFAERSPLQAHLLLPRLQQEPRQRRSSRRQQWLEQVQAEADCLLEHLLQQVQGPHLLATLVPNAALAASVETNHLCRGLCPPCVVATLHGGALDSAHVALRSA